MDIKRLLEEMTHFVASQGWFDVGSTRSQTPRNIAASLAIESAEVLELFQWGRVNYGRSWE